MVLRRLSSSHDGLSEAEAAERMKAHGPNRLPSSPAPSLSRRFLKQFDNLPIYALRAAAGISAILGQAVDTVVIVLVVILNAANRIIQEGRADQALEAILIMLVPTASVDREGLSSEVDVKLRVLGDSDRVEAVTG